MELLENNLIIFCCIVNFGKGSELLKLYRRLGSIGETVFLGRGTVNTKWLNILGVLDIRKEIIVAAFNKDLEDKIYDEISNRFDMNKPHNGIAFSIPLRRCLKVGDSEYKLNLEGKGVDSMDYESIFGIVDRGLSENVIEAARSAGSTGGTIIHGRGSGTRKKEKLFSIEVEPEKDIVLIVSKKEKTENIVNSIGEKLKIEEFNKGIIFVTDVSRTMGLYQE